MTPEDRASKILRSLDIGRKLPTATGDLLVAIAHEVRQAEKAMSFHWEAHMAVEMEGMQAKVNRLKDALEPFAKYANARINMPIIGLGDSLHTIHGGTEWEGEVTYSHCLAAKKAFEEE